MKNNNAIEFLEFVAKNQKRLKNNLCKNITYVPETLENVFQDTVIRCYDAIVKHSIIVKDFERYFFIASKYQYIAEDNRQKKMKSMFCDIEDYGDIDDFCCEELDELDELETRDTETKDRLYGLMNYISDTYGEQKAEIFFTFYTYKAEHKKISYSKISSELGVSIKDISRAMKEIKEDPIFMNIA